MNDKAGAVATRQQDALGNKREDATPETSASSLAEREKAIVQARIIQAIQRPRDSEAALQRVLKDCSRLRFAEEATYKLPRRSYNREKGRYEDTTIEDLSVRFAEAVFVAWGNIDCTSAVVWDEPDKRIIQVTVTDLESNANYSHGIVIDKLIERKKLRKNEVALETRIGAGNDKVYIVACSDSDIRMKTNSEISRVRRNLVLQIIPADVKDEAREKIAETIIEAIRKDPVIARRNQATAFAMMFFNIKTATMVSDHQRNQAKIQLAEYLGHPYDECTPEEMAELTGVGAAIKGEGVTWESIMEGRATEAEQQAERADLLSSIAGLRTNDAELYKRCCEELDIDSKMSGEELSVTEMSDILERAMAEEGADEQEAGEESQEEEAGKPETDQGSSTLFGKGEKAAEAAPGTKDTKADDGGKEKIS